MSYWKILGMCLLGLVCSGNIAIAQVVAEVAEDLGPKIDPALWAVLLDSISSSLGVDKFIATYLIVMTGLRALAEGGGYIAGKTGAKWDNRAVQWFSKSLNAVAWLAGLFGVGTPKNTKKPILKKKGI